MDKRLNIRTKDPLSTSIYKGFRNSMSTRERDQYIYISYYFTETMEIDVFKNKNKTSFLVKLVLAGCKQAQNLFGQRREYPLE